jgi:hypothetical protein
MENETPQLPAHPGVNAVKTPEQQSRWGGSAWNLPNFFGRPAERERV